MNLIKNLRNSIVQSDYTWTGSSFEKNLKIKIDSTGRISEIGSFENISSDIYFPNQAILPGFINAHSHAFQIGLRNYHKSDAENKNFWSWRSEMYKLASSLSDDDFFKISKSAFDEMKKSGITSVGEFHYLHHNKPKNDQTCVDYKFDRLILKAAKEANIRIVLLLAYYEKSGLDPNSILEPTQTQFLCENNEEFWKNFDELKKQLDTENQSLGVCAHSVRAVSLENIIKLKKEADKRGVVFHIHLEEQIQEIDETIKYTNKTPSQLLLDNINVDNKMTLVHCTHTEKSSLEKWIKKEVNICICPLTEAHLADGIFNGFDIENIEKYINLGTDCNFRISFVEEMRWILYLQHVKNQKRGLNKNISERYSIARTLFEMATINGAKSLGLANTCLFKKGDFADFFTIDLNHHNFNGYNSDSILETFILSTGGDSVILSTSVGGILSQYKENIIQANVEKKLLHVNNNQIDTSNLVTFLKTMIEIESITGNELNFSNALVEMFLSKNWKVFKQSVSSTRFNILATKTEFIPGQKGPKIILNSHSDVVPPHIPFSYDETNKILRGRGVCDAKGQILLQVLAAERFLKEFPEFTNDIGFLYVVGEEVDHIGMIEANKLGLQPEFLFCGEPTELKLAKRQKGILKFKLVSEGKVAHSGYPEKGQNSLNPLLDVLNDLRGEKWPSTEDLGETTMNIGILNSGNASNIIPGYSEAIIMFRIVSNPEEIMKRVEEIIKGRVNVVRITANGAVDFDVCESFEQNIVAFNTDVPYFNAPINMKKFLVGAGSITDAHGPNEFVLEEDLEKGIELIVKLIKKILIDKKI